MDSLNPPTLGKLSEVSFAAFPRWGWDGGVGGRMAGGLTCFTLDGSGPVPFPGSFFLPLAFPDTIVAALFFQVTFFSPVFYFFFSPLFHLFYLFLAVPKEKLTFQGPEGGGAGGKKKVSGKGKTRWHPDDASAHSGRGRAAARAMREGRAARDPSTFCAPVLGGVGGPWLVEGGRWWGGRGCEPPKTMSNPSPKLQQSRN